MRRIIYKVYRAFSTLLYWTKRRLTAGGWIVALAAVLTGGMATDVDQSIGYQAFAVLICLAFASMASAPFFRIRFKAQRLLPRFGTAGQPLHYYVSVKNSGKRTEAGLFVFDDLMNPEPTFDEFVRATQVTQRRKSFRVARPASLPKLGAPKPERLAPLVPNREQQVELQLLPLRRGAVHFRGISLARPDPFMLFRAFASVNLPATITILPKRYPLPNISLPGASRYQQGGVAFASSVGESEEFISVRDYRVGDPLRRIHWLSWAKAGRPVVKEYQDEFFVRHALILDTFTEPDDLEVFDEAVSVAASFACTIDTEESLLDLLFIGSQAYCFTIGRGRAHADQVLEILASVQTCGDKPFAALQQIVIEHSAVVSGCICIFLRWDEPRQQLVQKLEVLGVPVLVMLVRHESIPPAGSAPVQSAFAVNSPVHEIRVGKVAEDLAKL